MTEELHCAGCGAPIQNEDKNKAGYVPTSALVDRATVICQRCFRLKHYNEVQDVDMEDQDFRDKLHELGRKKALIVKIVDVFDFEGSWIPGFQRYVGDNPVLLMVNKTDLLPHSVNENKLLHWIRRQAKQQGLKPKEVVLLSAKNKQGIQEAASRLEELRNGMDVYVTGCTNVGKSTFINALIAEFGENEEQDITTSHFPGTTLDMIEVPLDEQTSLYDTPGLINDKQFGRKRSLKERREFIPEKELKPKVYQLESAQTIFIGGYVRMDFVEGDPNSFVVFMSNRLPVHRTKQDNADRLHPDRVGDVLKPPYRVEDAPELTKHRIEIKEEKTDIVVQGLGWITVTSPRASVDIYVPVGTGVSKREAVI